MGKHNIDQVQKKKTQKRYHFCLELRKKVCARVTTLANSPPPLQRWCVVAALCPGTKKLGEGNQVEKMENNIKYPPALP